MDHSSPTFHSVIPRIRVDRNSKIGMTKDRKTAIRPMLSRPSTTTVSPTCKCGISLRIVISRSAQSVEQQNSLAWHPVQALCCWIRTITSPGRTARTMPMRLSIVTIS